MYVCNVGIMFVCSSDQGRTVIPTVKSFIKLINQKINQIIISYCWMDAKILGLVRPQTDNQRVLSGQGKKCSCIILNSTVSTPDTYAVPGYENFLRTRHTNPSPP